MARFHFFRNKTDGLIYEWIKTDIFKLSNDEKKPESQPEPDANSNNARNTTSKTAKNTTANQGKKATLIFQYENEEIKLKDIDLENITDKATDSGKTEGSKTQENSRVQWKDRALFRVAIYWMFILLLIIATLAVVAFIQYCRLTTSKIGESFYCWRTNSQQTQGTFLIIFLLSIILLTIPIVHAYLQEALQNQLETVGFVGLISGVWAALAKLRQFMGKGDVFKTPWIGNLLFRAGAFLFIYALIIVAYDISVHIAPTTVSEPISWGKVLIAFFIFLVIFVAASYFFNINDSTVASMYRDRLMETFLPDTEAVKEKRWKKAIKANTVKLEKMCKKEKADKKYDLKPYHLINTNLILFRSDDEKLNNRHGDNFILSPKYCGSKAIGYINTENFNGERGITLATAMATSGAAINPHTGLAGSGPTIDRLVSFLMSFFNLRLGFWAINHNPKKGNSISGPKNLLPKPNYILPGLQSLLALGHSKEDTFIELSDGGHFENLGIYELVRRQVNTIIVSDATADKDFTFGDLANAIERVRADFGADIRFIPEAGNLGSLLPSSYSEPEDGKPAHSSFAKKFEMAEKGYAIGSIRYRNGTRGRIYLIKSTLIPNLPADLYGYRARNKDFPDQTTSDQFFDEHQFEAYRELGYRAALPVARECQWRIQYMK